MELSLDLSGDLHKSDEAFTPLLCFVSHETFVKLVKQSEREYQIEGIQQRPINFQDTILLSIHKNNEFESNLEDSFQRIVVKVLSGMMQ